MSFEKINNTVNFFENKPENKDGLEKFLTVREFLADKDFLGASLMGSKWAEYAGHGSQIRPHGTEERIRLIARIMKQLRKQDASIEVGRAANSTAVTYKRQDLEKGYEEYKRIYSRYQHHSYR